MKKEFNQKVDKEEVENYLKNYGHSRSNAMDEKFSMFKSDVSSMAQAYLKGELYVYEREEWIEFLEELIAEATEEGKAAFKEELEEFKQGNDSVVLNDINGYSTYL